MLDDGHHHSRNIILPTKFIKYYFKHQIKDYAIGRICNMNGRRENAYKILGEKPEG
jgi:hypothetical protein